MGANWTLLHLTPLDRARCREKEKKIQKYLVTDTFPDEIMKFWEHFK